jgi:flagellar motor switch protein FliM
MTDSILTADELDDFRDVVDEELEREAIGPDDDDDSLPLDLDGEGGLGDGSLGDAILSSRELEALRNAVEFDVLAPEEILGGGDGVLLDGEGLPRFRFGQRAGGAGREEQLSFVFDGAARALERRLSDVLETGIGATVTFLQVTRFAEFRETFEVDVRELAMLGFRIAGQPGQGLLALEPEIVERIVEGLMGGAAMGNAGGRSNRRNFRPTTPLDLRVCQRVMSGFLEDLGEVWNPAEPLQTSIVGADTTGVVAKIFADATPVVVGLIEVAVGRRLLGMVGIVLPRGAMDTLADPTASAEDAEPAQAVPNGPLVDELPAFAVDVEVQVGRREITVRELLALGVGDVLVLDGRQGAICAVQGVPKYLGIPGKKNGHKAFRIAEVIEHAG